MKKILILDGDSVAYRCASAAEERSIDVLHKPTGKSKVFKHRTEFKKSMLERGKEITDDYEVHDKQESEPLEYVLSTIKNHVKRITDYVEPDELIIYAGEQFNFRYDLPLPKPYKGNRSGNLRPLHLSKAKEFVRNKYKGSEAVGFEVDDACCIAAYDALRNGDKPIMYRYEKDQDSFNGITLLLDTAMGFEEKVVPNVGSLSYNKSTVKGDGLMFLAWQWICYDDSDHYCAYDLSQVKFGGKAGYDVLKDCKTEQEILLAVKQQFQTFYPDKFEYTCHKGEKHEADWKSMMDLYFRCARMLRKKDDPLDYRLLLDEYGVVIE